MERWKILCKVMWNGVESRWNPGGNRQKFGWALCQINSRWNDQESMGECKVLIAIHRNEGQEHWAYLRVNFHKRSIYSWTSSVGSRSSWSEQWTSLICSSRTIAIILPIHSRKSTIPWTLRKVLVPGNGAASLSIRRAIYPPFFKTSRKPSMNL